MCHTWHADASSTQTPCRQNINKETRGNDSPINQVSRWESERKRTQKGKRKDTVVVSLEPTCAQVCAMKCGGDPSQPTSNHQSKATQPLSFIECLVKSVQFLATSIVIFLPVLRSIRQLEGRERRAGSSAVEGASGFVSVRARWQERGWQ